MEPVIRYAHNADGYSIALWTIGDGPPLVAMPHVPWSHAEREWGFPEMRQWFQRLARGVTFTRYDSRGSGSSDRAASDYSLAAHVSDLGAVIDYLNLDTVILFAPQHSGPTAIAYAAEHPDKVSRLVLWCTYAFAADEYSSSPQLKATRALLDQDWEVYTETLAHVAWGWTASRAHDFARFIRMAVDRSVVVAVRNAVDEYDVTPLLSEVTCPTLVLHRRDFALPKVDVARRIASQIPDARLILLDGGSPAPWLGDTDAFFDGLSSFLGIDFPEPPRTTEPSQRLTTILVTDIEGSTEFTDRLGDAYARELLREHERITRDVLRAHAGTEVKTMGDGFMASFTSITKAVECAIALQKAFAERDGDPLSIRVGLNAGEPIEEEGDLFGATVILASRIAAKAEGGEILVADTVRGLCSGKGFLFADRGEFEAKGFEEPVRVYEVRWRDG